MRGNIHIKGQRLDLNLDTNVGKINLEINSSKKDYIHSRNFSYIVDTYSHDVLVGEEYSEKIKYIQINLSYGLSKLENPLEVFKMQNIRGKEYITNLLIYEINMDYYLEIWYTKNKKEIDKEYLLIMLGLEKNELKELARNNKVVLKYMDNLNKVNENPEFREYMSYEEDQRKILNTEKKLAKEEGIKERNIEITSKLLKTGMSITQISNIVDLSEKEIIDIKDSM